MSTKSNEPGRIPLTIPFARAGKKLDRPAGDAVPFTLIESGGQRYTAQNGYMVPFYPPESTDQNPRREQLVCDRAKRFFYTAEPGLDVRLTGRDLARAKDDYETCPITELQKIKARYLVGAMVNRMERLSRLMLQGNTDGVAIEIAPEGENHQLTPDQIALCKKEFVDHYLYLTTGAGVKPTSHVRLRNGAPDHDGVLSDLVRELGKPISTPEEKISGDILRKMGFTMAGIDEVISVLEPLLTHSVVDLALDKAYDRINERRYGEHYELGGEGGAQHYRRMLTELADLNRARCSLKSEDLDNFWPVRERIAYLNGQFFEMHKEMQRLSHMHGFTGVMRAQHLLSEGIDLMNEMAMQRLPKTHDSLDVGHDKKDAARDCSSVGILNDDVTAWLKDRARGISR